MKLSKIFFAIALLLITSQLSFATNPTSKEFDQQNSITVAEFLDLKYSDYKKANDLGFSIKARVNYFATKKFIKMQVDKGLVLEDDSLAEAAAGFSFKFGPFLVGFFLGLLGLLLVWIVVPKPRKNAMVSCLIGALVWGVLFGALFA